MATQVRSQVPSCVGFYCMLGCHRKSSCTRWCIRWKNWNKPECLKLAGMQSLHVCYCKYIGKSLSQFLQLKHKNLDQKQPDVGCILITTIHEKATKDTQIMITPIITFCSGVSSNSIKQSHHYLINGWTKLFSLLWNCLAAISNAV